MGACYRGRWGFALLALGLITVAAEGLAEDRPGFSTPRFLSNGQISFNYCIEHNKPQTCSALMYDIALDRYLAY
ncbi:MAG: hypothetical protein K8F53_05115 [Rhodocyclaceae bacterium]|nr:hypothetical protein [Rhodocyclaceae bacterium]MCZ7653750.1 hypothetical protein [Rhodocyclaceae bacterium]